MGARINMRPRVNFYVETGIYQVNPNAGNANDGFDLSFRSTVCSYLSNLVG